jgi:hypothetical protein
LIMGCLGQVHSMIGVGMQRPLALFGEAAVHGSSRPPIKALVGSSLGRHAELSTSRTTRTMKETSSSTSMKSHRKSPSVG